MPTIDLRTDSAGYVEGTKMASTVLRVGMLENRFLVPGVTYTQHLLTDAGDIEIPKVTKLTNGTRSALCDAHTAATMAVTYEALKIDSKEGGEFDGCFTVAGIADKNVERALNSAKLTQIGADFEAHVLTDIENNLTDYTTAWSGSGTNQYLQDLKKAYRIQTGYTAKIALVSLDFYYTAISEMSNLSNQLGADTYVTGADTPKMIAGLMVIPVDLLSRDVILYNPLGLNIGFPVNTKAIGGGILGDFDSSAMEFQGGLISYHQMPTNGSIVVKTWVLMPYGTLIAEPQWFLASPAVVTP